MIDALLYQPIYLVIVTILSLWCVVKYAGTTATIKENKIGAFILALFMALFIGFRPNHPVFADTVGYVASFDYLSGIKFHFTFDVENIIFDNLLAWMASLGFSYSGFFFVIALIYFGFTAVACSKFFPNNTWASFLVFLAAFSTFSYGVNGIKAGAAYAFFLCAIAFRDKKILALLFLTLSVGFHHGMFPCILAYVLTWFYKNTKVYLAFWLVCFCIAVLNITYFQELFVGFVDDKSASYINGEMTDGWFTGMRYDFVLYSFMPILVGCYVLYKKKIEIHEYRFVFNLYILLNGLWMLCMYASFTNRIAAHSWSMYPVVLTYPFLFTQNHSPRRNRVFATVIILHLAFTLFMEIVYY